MWEMVNVYPVYGGALGRGAAKAPKGDRRRDGNSMGNTYAVIIAVENYQQNSIKPILHGIADANGFRDVLLKQFNVPQDNIKIWLDEDATQNRLLHELPYEVSQLGPDDRFFFFYAGHGFFSKGTNRLTTWDSHPFNFDGTTVDLEAVLLKPLRDSKCQHNLVFIDACAAGLDEGDLLARDTIADMRTADFEELVKNSQYSAAFFSCSPNQKSYSSDALKHGIWSFYLLAALRGEAPAAIHRDNWITGESLKAYLRVEIPKYIREKTDIKGNQTPYAALHGDGLVEIRQVPNLPTAKGVSTGIVPQFARTRFRVVQTMAFKGMSGFDKKRGNTVPSTKNASADSWAKRLTKDALDKELGETKRRAKAALKIGRDEITVQFADAGGGTVDTEFFRYKIYAGQDDEDPGDIAIVRELTLRVPYKDLPAGFDGIFGKYMNEMVIPVKLDGLDFDGMAGILDKFANLTGVEFDEEESQGIATLNFSDGPEMVFDYEMGEIRISSSGVAGAIQLINVLASSTSTGLIGSPPPLLGTVRKQLTGD
jgi:uncharacterized caspase-like protein